MQAKPRVFLTMPTAGLFAQQEPAAPGWVWVLIVAAAVAFVLWWSLKDAGTEAPDDPPPPALDYPDQATIAGLSQEVEQEEPGPPD